MLRCSSRPLEVLTRRSSPQSAVCTALDCAVEHEHEHGDASRCGVVATCVIRIYSVSSSLCDSVAVHLVRRFYYCLSVHDITREPAAESRDAREVAAAKLQRRTRTSSGQVASRIQAHADSEYVLQSGA
jgi:hypothetical protein